MWIEQQQRNRNLLKWVSLAALLLAAAIWPWWVDDRFLLNVMINVLLYMVLGMGMHLIFGTAGLPFLGYAGFYGIGAYTAALLMTRGVSFWAALPASVAAVCLVALLFGAPILRLRGEYFMLGSLALGEIIHLTINNLDITGGPNGIVGIPKPRWFGGTLSQPVDFYYLLLVVVLVSIALLTYLQKSTVGRSWLALREDELAAEAVGVPTYRRKLQLFVLGSAWAGVAGAFLAARMGIVTPGSFTLMNSVQMIGIIIVGGMGSLPGVVLGTVLMIGLPEFVRALADWRLVIFGVAIMAVLRFRPRGIWPTKPWIVPLPATIPGSERATDPAAVEGQGGVRTRGY